MSRKSRRQNAESAKREAIVIRQTEHDLDISSGFVATNNNYNIIAGDKFMLHSGSSSDREVVVSELVEGFVVGITADITAQRITFPLPPPFCTSYFTSNIAVIFNQSPDSLDLEKLSRIFCSASEDCVRYMSTVEDLTKPGDYDDEVDSKDPNWIELNATADLSGDDSETSSDEYISDDDNDNEEEITLDVTMASEV